MNPLLHLLPLYLGTSEPAVRSTLLTQPAALLFRAGTRGRTDAGPFHLVFDWDSTVASNEGDLLIAAKGREAFAQHEWQHRGLPHAPGPLQPVFLAALARPEFRVSVLTARTGQEAHRVLTTLEAWRTTAAALHFAGNQPKGPIAAAIHADLFFDDILRHVKDAVAHGVNSGWVPFGDAAQ